MDFRHELKHEITYSDMLIIRQRLSVIAKPDIHAVNGKYQIRSLYFDTPADKALQEKIDGVSRREKFRIRYYNDNLSIIHLEKKNKLAGLGQKQKAPLTAGEAQAIVDGQIEWMTASKYPLIQELYSKMRTQCLSPKTIVDYTREPFIYAPGNVRITLDYNIRTGLNGTDFLNPHCITIPAGHFTYIMEVKWDAFLPSIIRNTIQLEGRRSSAFSKYAACRIYG